MIIGLVGKNGSGKGEVAKVLQEAGFRYDSLSDVLRQELKKQNQTVTRKNLTDFANGLRAQKGAGALAVIISQKLEPDQNYVIDSIRHPSEVEVLRGQDNFYLLAVEADPKIRFKRIKLRSRESDTLTYETFVDQEAKEAAGKKPTDQQLNQTLEMADARLENNGTLEELQQKVREIVQTLAMDIKRPGWDSYFIQIAKQVALRSNCIKRRVAAILVKDFRIISTGYNGTPRGIKNCNEGGCPRCQKFGASGTDLENCFCCHAEENAIVQAAYHGVQIKGATLYSTFSPCLACTKMIINAGIAEVVYSQVYPMEEKTLKLLGEAQIKARQWEGEK
ncbi:MAG: AAA family ATPase [Deltaproteobacteria bacterium]|nr:AAA family ATPase [Deltaproteobacteria bacterium]MBI4224046.1 AAA family ATPase [Deltaproteobacteria bacterium]